MVRTDYNLNEQCWIPVLWEDGTPKRVGIRDALLSAGHIRQIAATNPMDNVALLRLLLAVLQWCKPTQSEEERDALARADGVPAAWLARLTSQGHRFQLLGEGHRFYQDQDTEGKAAGKLGPINLFHDLPSGTNIAHFRHTQEISTPVCVSCCAVALVRWPCYASAGTAGGGQSMVASVNGPTPAFGIGNSVNLLATLRQTWGCLPVVSGDRPAWEGADPDTPLGALKGLTWQSRRVLLVTSDDGSPEAGAPCCYCGRQESPMVSEIRFRPGWPRPDDGYWDADPHLVRIERRVRSRSAPNSGKAVVPTAPGPSDASEAHAGVWRIAVEGELQRMIAGHGSLGAAVTTFIASSQQLYKDARAYVSDTPAMSRQSAERALQELAWLGELIRQATSARTGSWRDAPRGHCVVGATCRDGALGHAVRSALCAASARMEVTAERAFAELVSDLHRSDGDGDQGRPDAVERWRTQVTALARAQMQYAVRATATGSAMRRLQAEQQAIRLLDRAVRRLTADFSVQISSAVEATSESEVQDD